MKILKLNGIRFTVRFVTKSFFMTESDFYKTRLLSIPIKFVPLSLSGFVDQLFPRTTIISRK